MKYKLLLFMIGILAIGISGCGKVPPDEELQQMVGQTTAKEVYIDMIDISLDQQNQSVQIQPTVVSNMTFNAQSNLHFGSLTGGKVEADGSIVLNLSCNNLDDPDLLQVRLKCRTMGADGLVGQQNGHVIPLELATVGEHNYVPLTTGCVVIRTWQTPFDKAINKTFQLKLRGDFTNATDQQYKGTLKLYFVRDEL